MAHSNIGVSNQVQKEKSFSYHRLLSKIREKNFASVPFTMTRKELENAASSFLAFLKLPQETKEQFRFTVDKKRRGAHVGYSRKVQEKGALDNKEYFHYNLYTEAFTNLPERQNPVVETFFKNAHAVYENGARAIGKIMEAFETAFPGIHGKFFPNNATPNFYLRFLKYDVVGRGNFLAKAHYDRGGCTLALAESAPGLRIGKNQETLREVEHKENSALFMPAWNLRKVTSDEFGPAWHDVVQRSGDTLNAETARWAIVFFADPMGMDEISVEETHTPIY